MLAPGTWKMLSEGMMLMGQVGTRMSGMSRSLWAGRLVLVLAGRLSKGTLMLGTWKWWDPCP